MKEIIEAIKKAVRGENMPHTREEMNDFAMDIAMGLTASPKRLVPVSGNPNKLLGKLLPKSKNLKDKLIEVKEGDTLKSLFRTKK